MFLDVYLMRSYQLNLLRFYLSLNEITINKEFSEQKHENWIYWQADQNARPVPVRTISRSSYDIHQPYGVQIYIHAEKHLRQLESRNNHWKYLRYGNFHCLGNWIKETGWYNLLSIIIYNQCYPKCVVRVHQTMNESVHHHIPRIIRKE